jgi:PAS domain S-box-containing protein
MGAGERKTILLVEDESLIALDERLQLEKYGYAVLSADSGEKAIETFRSTDAIDLILMDIDLGKGIDGVETARRILKDRNIPVVFLSNHIESEIVEKTERTTSYGYVVKSSSIAVLDASIKMAFKLFEAGQASTKAMNTLEATFNALPDELFEMGLDGRYIDCRFPNEESPHGSPSELLGRKVSDILPSEASETVMSSIREANEKGSSFGKQYALAAPAGTRWFEISTSRMVGYPREPRFILLCRDITERKLLEKRYVASNRMFRAVLDAMPQFICWKDRNSVFLGCNKNHAGLFYLPSTDAIIGKTDWDLHRDKVEIDKFIRDDNAVMEADKPLYHIIERASYPNGKKRWLDTNKVPLHDENGNVDGIMIAYSDITEKREMEDALEHEQYLLQTLMETSPDHIYFKDRESRFIRVSKSQCLRFGCRDYSEVLGKSDFDFFSVEHAREAYEDEQRIVETGEAVIKEEKETWNDRPDSWVYSIKMPLVDKRGSIVGTFGISRDISELKKAQEALKESNDRCHVIIERMSDYIFTVYLEGGKILKTVHNPACVAVTGYTADEFAADTYLWYDMILPEDQGRAEEQARRILSDASADAIEHRIRRKDGAVRWIRNTPVLHRDADGKLVSYDGIIVDITERKLAEEEVQRLLREKELILKEVHHRVKNNLNTINSILNLQASTQSDPNAIKAFNDAGSRVQSMMVLYDKLFQSANFLAADIKEYLPALVHEIVDNFPNSSMVKIETNVGAFELSSKILQPLGIIINELLTNIMKYAFKGRKEGTIRLSASLRGSKVHIEIHDDGVGLPEGVDFKNSTGFGLTLINMLTKQLGGEIKIARENGTRIILEFEK